MPVLKAATCKLSLRNYAQTITASTQIIRGNQSFIFVLGRELMFHDVRSLRTTTESKTLVIALDGAHFAL